MDQTAVQPSKVIVIGQLPPPVNGSNQMTQVLMDTLNELQLNPELVDKRFSKNNSEVGRFVFSKILEIPKFWLRVFSSGKNADSQNRAVAIYFTTSNLPSFLIDLVSIIILTMHKVEVFSYLHTSKYRYLANKSPVHFFLVRQLFSLSNKIVCISPELRKQLEGLVSEEKVLVIPNAIGSPRNTLSSTKINIPEDKYLLFLSNIERSKGIVDFIDICQKVHYSNPDVKFVIVGAESDPELVAKIKKQVEFSTFRDSMIWLGPVYGIDKFKIIESATCLIYPSYNDAFPITLLESLSQGTPVIAYETGGIPSIIEHSKNGLLCKQGDISELLTQALSIINSSELRAKMSKSCSDIYSKKFTQEAFTANWKSALQIENII